jgi:cytochrome P450
MIDALRRYADGRRARREALAHLPGDFGPPVLGHTLKILASQADFTRGMHARFGLVHRSASFFEEYVMLLGPEANQRVLLDREGLFTAGGGWEHHFSRLFPRCLLVMGGAEHALHRRAMSEPFRAPAMRVYAEQMHDPVARAVASWRARGAVRFYPAVRALTLELAMQLFLGLSLGDELDAVARDFEAVLEAAAAVAPVAIPGSTFARGLRAREALLARLRALTAARRAQPGRDLLSRLLAVRLEGDRSLTDDEVTDHLLFLVAAAHDTTASALSMALYLLAVHPAWQERLRDASRALPLALDAEALGGLRAHDQVFRETLRLYPAITAIPRRTTRACEVLGHRIPAETVVYLSPVFTHRMPSLWRDPERFDPERFAPHRAEHEAHPYAFVPFGGGAHACLGLSFARLQVLLVLHHLCREARWTLPAWHPRRVHWLPVPRPYFDLPLRFS